MATDLVRLFTGFDPREAAGWHAFAQSVIERSSIPVALIPLQAKEQRDGSNTFTYSRFMVPHLCGHEGFAIFADGADMICLDDIAELWAMCDERYAVQVVKHDYKTKHQRKYRGTEMECDNRDYPRKNWSSFAIWNNAHPANRILTPLNVSEWSGQQLHGFSWLPDDLIGDLPLRWNWLADEYADPAGKDIALFHYTAGLPALPAYQFTHGATHWHYFNQRANELPWAK
jgi:lipopolysaccharide biosynthesis glycosyltransferase